MEFVSVRKLLRKSCARKKKRRDDWRPKLPSRMAFFERLEERALRIHTPGRRDDTRLILEVDMAGTVMAARKAVHDVKGAFVDQRGGDRRADPAGCADYDRCLLALSLHDGRLAVAGAQVKGSRCCCEHEKSVIPLP